MPERDVCDRARQALDNEARLPICRPVCVWPGIVRELVAEVEAARETAAQWEGLWRQDQETAATALRERDQALAEVEQLRGNQRVEQLEPWLGKCKGSD